MSGWRKGEIQTLSWPDVDRTHGRITLRRAHSKNREPRILTLVGSLAALIERRWAAAREYETANGMTMLSPWVFHRAGRPVGDFRKTWMAACKAAGVAGVLFHDLRRSAVRNFERAGVSQGVAMKIIGQDREYLLAVSDCGRGGHSGGPRPDGGQPPRGPSGHGQTAS